MRRDTLYVVIILSLIGGLLFVHRRVIKAIITGGPMPKAPAWHFWVKKEGRRVEKKG